MTTPSEESPVEEVVYELEPSRVPKPIPVALEDLCKQTKFSRQEIRIMYRGFKTKPKPPRRPLKRKAEGPIELVEPVKQPDETVEHVHNEEIASTSVVVSTSRSTSVSPPHKKIMESPTKKNLRTLLKENQLKASYETVETSSDLLRKCHMNSSQCGLNMLADCIAANGFEASQHFFPLENEFTFRLLTEVLWGQEFEYYCMNNNVVQEHQSYCKISLLKAQEL
ncbi:hypothetical protein RN001_005858 [Aquatica leii]|uniref:Uncharacterized protein n=1 Tax=Aquatica leii TaxID=1421715 RepID=A0AAN7SJ89_9COLE|nr:hypothetical protein RN001_005858 [Aquatica leii]